MSASPEIVVAAKCPPKENILIDIEKAGLTAVELFINLKQSLLVNKDSKL